jgi:hypothetical protein
MDGKQSADVTENSGNDMEASILSAHKKFFEGKADAHRGLTGAESVLYDSIIRYFEGNP